MKRLLKEGEERMMRKCHGHIYSGPPRPGPKRAATLLAAVLSFGVACAGAVDIDLDPLPPLILTPGGAISATATAGQPRCDSLIDEKIWDWSTLDRAYWESSENTSDFNYSDPGTLQHCDPISSTINVVAYCQDDEGTINNSTTGTATVTITYLDPLTISSGTRVLEGSPGSTVTFTASFSGGLAPVNTPSSTPLGGTADVTRTQVTYVYRIPLDQQAGTLTDTVRLSGTTTSCGGDSAEIAVTINVLPGPTIAPDPLTLSGSPGATVSGDLTVSGGTADYRWQANNGGSVDPTTGSSVTYSYRIPEDATAGTRSDTVTVTDANGATDEAIVTINVLPGPTIAPDPLTLSGSPGATVSGDLAVSGGTADYRWQANNGGSVDPTTGSSVSYSYRIPEDAPAGTRSDTVTVTDANGATDEATVTINVLAGPTIAPDPLILSGSPGATVSGDLAVSGGTAGYRWQANNGGSVDPTIGSSVTYSYSIPEDATAGTRSDTVTVTDANGATYTSRVNI